MAQNTTMAIRKACKNGLQFEAMLVFITTVLSGGQRGSEKLLLGYGSLQAFCPELARPGSVDETNKVTPSFTRNLLL
jgi:hypothetical protein